MTSAARDYEERIRRTLTELGLPPALLGQQKQPSHWECDDLVSIGPDALGREQRLERHTATHWLAMMAAAQADGAILLAISGFRSFDYQRGIIARKLAAGQTPQEIFRVNVLPGYSEHHTGRAIDIGTPGCPHLTEAFAETAAFRWLTEHAERFGFVLSYPRDNPHGVAFEPWHWCRQPSKT